MHKYSKLQRESYFVVDTQWRESNAAKRNVKSLIHRLCEVFECASMQQSTHWKITVAQSFSNHANAAAVLFLVFIVSILNGIIITRRRSRRFCLDWNGSELLHKNGKIGRRVCISPELLSEEKEWNLSRGQFDCYSRLRCVYTACDPFPSWREHNSTKGISRRPEASRARIRWKIVYIIINTVLECDGWFHKQQQHNTIRYGFRKDTTDNGDAMGASEGATRNEKWTKPHRNEAIINLRSSSSCTHNILCNSREPSLNSFIRSPWTICRWLLEFDRKKCKFIYQWGERDDDFLKRVQKFATGFERFAVGAVDHRPRWGDGVLRSKRKRCMRQAEQCAIQLIISAFLHLNNNNWSVVGQFCCSVVLLLTSSMKCTPLVLFVVVVALLLCERKRLGKRRNSTIFIEMKTRNPIELLPLRLAQCGRLMWGTFVGLPLIMTFKKIRTYIYILKNVKSVPNFQVKID